MMKGQVGYEPRGGIGCTSETKRGYGSDYVEMVDEKGTNLGEL